MNKANDSDGVVNSCDDCPARGGTGQACSGAKEGLATKFSCSVEPPAPGDSPATSIGISVLLIGLGLTLSRLRRTGRGSDPR